jgi:hypothetical protein
VDPAFQVLRLWTSSEFRRLVGEAERFARAKSGVYRSKRKSWMETAEGGPVFRALARSRGLLDRLRRLTGRRWRPDRKKGSYLYYRRPTQSSALHRDNAACELVLLTCLYSKPGPGGQLVLYPGRNGESLPAIARTPRRGARIVRLRAGETLVMDGRRIAHRVTRLGRGRVRVTAARCFRAL